MCGERGRNGPKFTICRFGRLAALPNRSPKGTFATVPRGPLSRTGGDRWQGCWFSLPEQHVSQTPFNPLLYPAGALLNDFRAKWRRLKSWQSAIWQPVLPPLGAVIELAALTLLLLTIDWMLPNVDLADIEPSPYWLPVLLLSLQYGTVAGLLAASVATAVYVFNGFPEQAIGENLFTYLLRIWALPILWVGASLILGQFRLRQIEMKQNLRRELDLRSAEAKSLAGYNSALESRCKRLERQLAVNAAGEPSGVLDALAHFSAADAGMAESFDALVRTILPGATASLYAATPFGFTLIARSGAEASAAWPAEIEASHPLARHLNGERRTVSVFNKGDEALLFQGGIDHGLVAHPVLAPDASRVVGLIKIEAADPRLIDANTGARLGVVAKLAAPALAEPRIVVNNEERDIVHGARQNELTKGWRQLTWRVITSDESAAVPQGEAAPPSSRPGRAK